MYTRRNILIVTAFAAFLILMVTGLTWAEGKPVIHSSPDSPVDTGFTYQGYLTDSGSPADGTHLRRDSLWMILGEVVFGGLAADSL